MTFLQRVFRHPILLVVAVALGTSVQFTNRWLFNEALGRPFIIDEPFVFVISSLLSALPLIILALKERQHIVAWTAGLALSAWLAWWSLQKGIAYQRNPDGSGVDMGLALVMLFAPFVITALCLLLNHLLTRNGNDADAD